MVAGETSALAPAGNAGGAELGRVVRKVLRSRQENLEPGKAAVASLADKVASSYALCYGMQSKCFSWLLTSTRQAVCNGKRLQQQYKRRLAARCIC